MGNLAEYLEERAELHKFARTNEDKALCTIWTKDGKTHTMRAVEAHACLCELGLWEGLHDETAPLSNGARIMRDATASKGFGKMIELHLMCDFGR
jgi:hypothetical protein